VVVAIDGPAGAGKSTTARLLAETLGYSLLDTGAIYRALAYLARQKGVSWDDGAALAALARDLDIRFELRDGVNRVWLGDEELGEAIRTAEIAAGASRVSSSAPVREALLDLQRRLGAGGGVVVEGRDIGSVVFPSAAAKFYLTATLDERARRRARELALAGRSQDPDAVKRDIEERDARDMGRASAPLKKAEGAVEIDSSELPVEDVVARMAAIVRARAGN
jgi:cytidylate kinase